MCAKQSEAHTEKTFKRVGLEASGARVVYRGGNANNGSNAGAGYVNVNNGLTNTNANIGSRLYADQDFFSSFKRPFQPVTCKKVNGEKYKDTLVVKTERCQDTQS